MGKTNKKAYTFEKLLIDSTLRTNMVQKSFEYFFPIYFNRHIQYDAAPFHREIMRILEDVDIKLAVVVAFRGSAKSTIMTTAYPLWAILGEQKKKFIVIASQTEQKAQQALKNIKIELQQNELLRNDLGPFEEERNSLGNATALIIKRLGVKIMAVSVGQSIRGLRHGEHRPDLVIFDDIEDQLSTKTREGRNKTFEWFTGEVMPAGDKETRFIFVGNLLHEDAVMRRLQKQIEAGSFDMLQAVYREYSIFDNDGNPAWPGKYQTAEDIEIERQKTIDNVTWYREYLLKIISTADQVIKPEWLHYYDEQPNERPRAIAIGVDLAISEKDTADCTAAVTAHAHGHGKNFKLYIQPSPLNERIDCPTQIAYISAHIENCRKESSRVKTFIESVGYQEAIVQLLNQKNYDVEACYTNGASKHARLQLTSSMVQDGRIVFPKTGCEELITQLVGFGKESHDDLADAFSVMVIKVLEHYKFFNRPNFGHMERPDKI